MCGICGTVGILGVSEAQRAIRRMNAAIIHRGPDDEGELIAPAGAPGVAFGMRRLSIIDLGGGHQPVYNETGDVAIVYNGEIYNFHDLRRQLERAGHIFRTNSDTEVIVHAYEEWGEACLDRLRGMFAIALLDMRASIPGNPKVLLARDRLGIKPFYYAVKNGTIVFASEVRAILASELVPRRISTGALNSFLLFGSVSEPMTLVDGVFSLPPGHFISMRVPTAGAAPRSSLKPAAISASDVHPRAYWSFGEAAQPDQTQTAPATLGSAAKLLRPLLEDAVDCHLIADVPLGVFLSSGLDSTAMVALASRARGGLNTFTVVFDEQDFSEAEISRRTARRFHTNHEEFLLRGTEVLDRLDEAVNSLDQPSMDGINTYFVSWAARRVGLKVALSGLGGDEVFGGYSTFSSTPRVAQLAAFGRLVPRVLRNVTAAAVGRAGAAPGDAARKLSALWADPQALPHPYFFTRALFTPRQVKALHHDPQTANLAKVAGNGDSAGGIFGNADLPWRRWTAESVRQAAMLDSFAGVSCLESRSYMVQTLLRDTDSVSMANSLEVRVPLLDHLLVESVARLPPTVKQRRGVSKALLAESLRDLLPVEVTQQRKRTFTLPWEHWLRGPLAGRMGAGFFELAPSLAPHLDAEAVQALWPAFQSGETSWSRPWALYVLNEWCRRNLDTPNSAISVPSAAASAKPA